MKKVAKTIPVSWGLSLLLVGSSAFGALQFTPPDVLSSGGIVSGNGSAFKTKLVRMGNGMLVSVYGDSVASDHDVYDLKADAVRKARDVFARTCTPSDANDQCGVESAWSAAVNISNTADLTSIDTKWERIADGSVSTTASAFYGDSDKPNIFNSGTFAVVTWTDKYCGDINGGADQRIVSYNERGGISVPFSCMYESHIDFSDPTPTWTTTQLTNGERDAKQDVNKGVTIAGKGQWFTTWQEDPHGLQIGGGDGPGEGASGAGVTHGTDIWYSSTTDLMATPFSAPERLTDNFVQMSEGGNANPVYDNTGLTEITSLESGTGGASRANTAVVALTTGETEPTVIVTYEETKGSDGIDNGKYVRYHSFPFSTPDMNDSGAIISDPAENSRRVRFVTQTNPSNGLRMGIFWRQGNPVEGGPGDIMVRLGYKGTDAGSSGLRVADMVPAVDSNARTSVYADAIALNNTPAYNISSNTIPWSGVGGEELASTNNLTDTTDLNPDEDARAHRAAIRGDDFYIGYSYAKDWAVATYTDMDNYNFWFRRYNALTDSWTTAKNLSNITDKKIHVKEPRLVGMPGNGPGCSTPADPASITNAENCQNKNALIVAWGVESNVYAHIGGAVEGDIYYTRTKDKGVTFNGVSVVEGIGASNRYESQLRSTPAGNIIWTVWNEANNDAGLGGEYSMLSTSTSEDAVTVTSPSSDGGSSFSVNDNMSLMAMIFGFLTIGGLIARKKLAL